jgi:hypothetical protein
VSVRLTTRTAPAAIVPCSANINRLPPPNVISVLGDHHVEPANGERRSRIKPENAPAAETPPAWRRLRVTLAS